MQYLEITFEKYRSVIGTSSAPNESLSECFIIVVLFNCVLEERMAMEAVKSKATSAPSSSTSLLPATAVRGMPDSTSSFSSENAEICLYFETEMKQNIRFKGSTYVLRGIVDYSLGYSQGDIGSGNLVVVEAKRRFQMSRAYGPLLSYMGL